MLKNAAVFCLLFLALLAASCRTEGNLMLRRSVAERSQHNRAGRQSNFIVLKNGDRIALTEHQLLQLETQPGGGADSAKFGAGDTSVVWRDIGAIVTPTSWTNVNRTPGTETRKSPDAGMPSFEKSYMGPRINYYVSHTSEQVYGYQSNGQFGSSTSHTLHHYIQQGDTGRIVRFRYAALRQMIPATDPASPYLVRYRKHKTVFNSIRWTGLGCLVAGTALLCVGDPPYTAIGGTMLAAGLPIITIGGILQSKNIKRNLHRAFWMYNGADWRHSRHRPL